MREALSKCGRRKKEISEEEHPEESKKRIVRPATEMGVRYSMGGGKQEDRVLQMRRERNTSLSITNNNNNNNNIINVPQHPTPTSCHKYTPVVVAYPSHIGVHHSNSKSDPRGLLGVIDNNTRNINMNTANIINRGIPVCNARLGKENKDLNLNANKNPGPRRPNTTNPFLSRLAGHRHSLGNILYIYIYIYIAVQISNSGCLSPMSNKIGVNIHPNTARGAAPQLGHGELKAQTPRDNLVQNPHHRPATAALSAASGYKKGGKNCQMIRGKSRK